MSEKQPRHRCNNCGAVRLERFMQVKDKSKSGKTTYWKCVDCWDNRAFNPFDGMAFLFSTYNPLDSI